MKIKKVDDKPMDMHTKRKMKVHVKEDAFTHAAQAEREYQAGGRAKEQVSSTHKVNAEISKSQKRKQQKDKRRGVIRKKNFTKKKDIKKRMFEQFISGKHSKEDTVDLIDTVRDMVKMRLSGAVQAVMGYAVLTLGSLLAVISLVAVPILALVVCLYHSPFAVMLPSVSSTETTQEVLALYLREFEEKVNRELDYLDGSDESELFYVDYVDAGKPDTYKDILAVYMVRYGVGSVATDMTDSAKRKLKRVCGDMCSYSVSYRIEKVPDEKGKLKKKEFKEVHVHYKTYEDMVTIYDFREEEQEMLLELMQMLVS